MKTIVKFLVIGFLPVLLAGCGSQKLGEKFNLSLDPSTQTAALEVEMSEGLDVGLQGGYSYSGADFVNVYFVPATQTTNAKIGVKVDVAKATGLSLDQTMDQITTLPNGAPLPLAMEPKELTKVSVYEDQNMTVSGVFALKPNMMVGTFVAVKALTGADIPGGISLCQNFRDSNKVAVASICLYGPSADGTPGGLFVGGNLGAVIPEAVPVRAVRAPSSTDSSSSRVTLKAVNVTTSKSQKTTYDPNGQLRTKKQRRDAEDRVREVLKPKYLK